MNFIKPKIN